jgi:hypothetical protein
MQVLSSTDSSLCAICSLDAVGMSLLGADS